VTRRPKTTAPEAPAADPQPVPVGRPVDELRQVTIRADHRHRGVAYAEPTPYRATPAEIELLHRYGALVEH